jgi:hypothetical protein
LLIVFCTLFPFSQFPINTNGHKTYTCIFFSFALVVLIFVARADSLLGFGPEEYYAQSLESCIQCVQRSGNPGESLSSPSPASPSHFHID